MGNLVVKDGNGAAQNLSVVVNTDTSFTGTTCIQDPLVQANKVTVAQFHNADNQSPGGTAFGLLTGGVAQLLNIAGNLDRAREGGLDNVAPQGLTAGVTLKKSVFKTTSATNAAIGSSQITLTNVSGNINGVPWKVQAGSVITIDSGGATPETVLVTAVNTGTKVVTFTPVTTATHNGSGTPIGVTGNAYNEERDATGENDSANGAGASVAVEMEYNAGDASGGNFDRARNVNGKGITTATINAGGTQGSTSLTLSATPPASGVGSLQPGMKVLLYVNGQLPTAGQYEVVDIDLAYIQGSATVPLASATVNAVTYNRMAYDSFAGLGPLGNTFTGFGLGMEAIALTDLVTGFHTQLKQAPGAPGVVAVSSDGSKATYRYAVQAFTPVATPTAFFQIAGSATKTVRVKRIKIGGVATSNGNMQVQMSRWSTAGTPGSAVLTGVTAVKHDTGDAAATATVSTVGTANYTTQGTGNATLLSADRIFLATTATGATQQLIYDFSTRQDKAFILRGTTDILSLSGNGSAVPAGGVLDIEVETEEDNS